MSSFIGRMSNYVLNAMNLSSSQSEPAKLILLGLDSAGKSTMLYKIKKHRDEVETTIPTIGFNVETLEYDRTKFICWDVGGCDKIRPLWRHYTEGLHAIIFVIDSNDHSRIEAAKDELFIFMNDETTRGVPVLFIANKQDMPNAKTCDSLIHELELHRIRDRLWYIIPAIATTGYGLRDAFTWLQAVLRVGMDPSYDSNSITIPAAGIYSKQYFAQTDANTSTASDATPNHDAIEIPRPVLIFNATGIITGPAPSQDIIIEQKQAELRDTQRRTTISAWIDRASHEALSDDDFLEQVRTYSLGSWDHYTHIRLGWIVLWRHGTAIGYDMVASMIQDFIQHSSRTNGKSYHATMTRYWATMIAYGMMYTMKELQAVHDEKERFVCYMRRAPAIADLWDPASFKRYYSAAVMFSAEARTMFTEPDVQPLPNVNDIEGNAGTINEQISS